MITTHDRVTENPAHGRRTSSEPTLDGGNRQERTPSPGTDGRPQEDANGGFTDDSERKQDSDSGKGENEKDEEQNETEKDEEAGQEGKPQTVGFWHPKLAKTRRFVIINWLRTILIISVAILAILSLYWAVLYHVEENLEALKVVVVSFDGQFAPYTSVTPLVGPAVIQATEQLVQQPGHLGWMTRSPADYNNDPMRVRLAVYSEQVWAAVIINNNATALLQQAVAQGNASYQPLGAAQIIYNQARDQDTYSEYIVPVLQQLQTDVVSQFSKTWIPQVLNDPSLSAKTYANTPQALSPAIGFSTFNLRPFYPSTATPAVTIGLIYLIIIAFFSFSFFLPIHTKYVQPEGHPPMHFYQLIIWRWLATVVAYFFMSLAYSFVSLAFQIPFSNPPASHTMVGNNSDAYGRGTFPVYWMLNFVGMAALGLACENAAMIIGQPWTALWLIFWVITNVSTSFYVIPLSPRFFRWGYAWPLHQIVNGSRTLIFGTYSRIGMNFGILFAWCAVNTILFPFCCTFMRYFFLKGKYKEQGKGKPTIRECLE